MFRIKSKIGNGSFGEVFKASRESDGQVVALKMIPKYGECTSREISILQKLNHPNIIPIFSHFFCSVSNSNKKKEFKRARIIQVIVMKFYPQNLKQFLKLSGPLSIKNTKILMKQLCQGISYSHSMQITHRDIKSSNILIDPNNLKLVLADFGCAKDLTIDSINMIYTGSRYYRAPELLLNSSHYNEKIDIWSIGCVIYECLEGSPPFKGL